MVERKKRLDEEVYVTQPPGYVKGERGEIRGNQVMAEISGGGDEFLPEVSDNSLKVESYQVFFVVNIALLFTIFSFITPFILLSEHEIVYCGPA